MILVADIGGTNARFAVVSSIDGRPAMTARATYPSRDFPSFGQALAAYVDETAEAKACRQACFGVAGPVLGERCELTHLPWVVDATTIAARFGFARVRLFNDVEAAARGLGHLGADGFVTLRTGRVDPTGQRLLLAPGTGLGAAGVMRRPGGDRALASETGGTDFAPTDEEEIALWRFAKRRFGHVHWEHLVSGSALPTLCRFVLEQTGRGEPEWLRDAVAQGHPGATISHRARTDRCPICVRALALFFRLLGTKAGNLALDRLATGGVYLAGGLLPKLQPELRESEFLAAFDARGTYRKLAQSIPIHLVIDDRLALWGAATAFAHDGVPSHLSEATL